LKEIELLAKPDRSLVAIMKAGRFHRNRLN